MIPLAIPRLVPVPENEPIELGEPLNVILETVTPGPIKVF
jgi:hypothetical protein